VSRITAQYLHELQSIYHQIDSRGIVVSKERLNEAQTYINTDIAKQCQLISSHWGIHCYIGSKNKPTGKDTRSINLNSSSGSNTPLSYLKDTLKFKIPKVSSRDEDGNYISKDSLAELSLQKIYAENQFGTPGGDPAIRALLRIRELSTLKSRYLNANFFRGTGADRDLLLFLTNYNAAGTVTGRRGSRKHAFSYGGNAQNFPKHGELAKIFRRCLVARPGKILLMVDQMQAEDWPVSALAENHEALKDLINGVDRHRKLACSIFDYTWDHFDEQGWKDSIERYLGKKTRHANNYGMKGNTMSDSLAKEGHSLTPLQCTVILDKVNKIDPSVDGVFHAYVRKQLDVNRTLQTPFSRERIFFGLRPGEVSANNKIFNEAYSYIPQSTVGDNNGLALHYVETHPKIKPAVINECHDSIIQEIDDNPDVVWEYLQRTKDAYKRKIRFYNGIEVEIPTEGELGYDFYTTKTLKAKNGSKKLEDLTYQDVQAVIYKLRSERDGQTL
jgi:hypothetical protein